MIHLDVTQGSKEWFLARLGIPTASEFHKILTPKTMKLSTQAEPYLHRLLAEWLLGTPFEQETTVWSMEVGIEREEEAAQYYELTTGNTTNLAGFCLTDDRKIGASPDRLVGEKGLVEIKCPLASTHVGYLLNGELPVDYLPQLQGQLYVSGRAWCDFLSYYPGLPSLLVRVEPWPAYQQTLAIILREFCARLEQGKQQLQAIKEHTNERR